MSMGCTYLFIYTKIYEFFFTFVIEGTPEKVLNVKEVNLQTKCLF